METTTVSGIHVLTSPNAVGLPAAERGDAPTSLTRALVDAKWPQIEEVLAEGRMLSAIPLMEALAEEMRFTTLRDPLLFRDALTLARQILYEDLFLVGQDAACKEPVRAVLQRCAEWDEDLRPHLEALMTRCGIRPNRQARHESSGPRVKEDLTGGDIPGGKLQKRARLLTESNRLCRPSGASPRCPGG